VIILHLNAVDKPQINNILINFGVNHRFERFSARGRGQWFGHGISFVTRFKKSGY